MSCVTEMGLLSSDAVVQASVQVDLIRQRIRRHIRYSYAVFYRNKIVSSGRSMVANSYQ